MSAYLKKYTTPAACYRKAPVRRESRMERLYRQRRHYRLDTTRAAADLIPHEGKPVVFTIITNQPRKG